VGAHWLRHCDNRGFQFPFLPSCFGTSLFSPRCPLEMRSRTMRTSMAYFAGAGTVVAAVLIGLGGGLMIANIVSPHTTEMSKLERRMSAAPIPVPNAPSDPAPYLAAT